MGAVIKQTELLEEDRQTVTDITDYPSIERALEDYQPDVIIHLAAIASVTFGNLAESLFFSNYGKWPDDLDIKVFFILPANHFKNHFRIRIGFIGQHLIRELRRRNADYMGAVIKQTVLYLVSFFDKQHRYNNI